MLNTVKAVVQGDRIHWQETVDSLLSPDQSAEVLVTILRNQPNGLSLEEKGQRRIAALKKLAAENAFSGISDPAQWERETREDRHLPGRGS